MTKRIGNTIERKHIMQAYALCLRQLRKKRGLSQEMLAYESGVDRGYVGRLERAENMPTIDIVWRLLPTLGIDYVEWAKAFLRCLRKVERRSNQ